MQMILEDDLVGACKPGDRVSVVGIYKSLAPVAKGTVPALFKTTLVANSVGQLYKAASQELKGQDVRS